MIRDIDAMFHEQVSEQMSEQVIEQNGTQVAVVSPADPQRARDLARCGANVREVVERAKTRFGGVLLRGFAPLGVAGFERFAADFGKPLLDYEFGSTPRSRVEKGVYSSTEYPADQWIDQHNEQSYTLRWPASILFYCDVAPQSRGATPVADSRRVHARLDAALRARFAAHGVMYVRNYGNGLDVPWEQVFGTQDHREVERYCRANRIECEWLDDGETLRTRQVCQSEARHPVTGDRVWFNQAHLFHVSNLPPTVREALLEVVDEDRLPRNTFFGDGTPIDPSMLDDIRAVYRDTMLCFPWQAGDTLVLDNMLMSHGRAPFTGKRRVLVAMSA